MKLSVRLQAVADLVPAGARVADIGCDHGYVSVYLAKNRLCPRVIAMDVKPGPLARARENVRQSGLEDYIETRLSDGADALAKGEADTLLLSGMGARLMIRIIERAAARLGRVERLILQPQSELYLVRAFLRDGGYIIVEEAMVKEDGKYYSMLRAEPGTLQSAGEAASAGLYRQRTEDYFGPLLLRQRPGVLEEFLQREKEKTEAILAGVPKGARRGELEAYLSCIREAEQGFCG